MKKEIKKEMITVKQFAEEAGYSVAYILKLIKDGKIKNVHRPTPRKTKIAKSELSKFIGE